MRRLRLRIIDEHGGSSLTPRLIERLHAALGREHDARVITIEGGPAAFCTGMDPGELVAPETSSRVAQTEEQLRRYAMLLEAIERTPLPVLALIDGPVLGGGVGIAAAADLVIATRQAKFSLPESLLGLIPAMAFPVLARRIGVPRARWLALGAAAVSAEDARHMGLVDEVATDLEAASERYNRRLERMDRHALAEIKRLIAEHHRSEHAYITDAAARFRRLLERPETQTRLARFAEGWAPWPDDSGRDTEQGANEPPAAAETP